MLPRPLVQFCSAPLVHFHTALDIDNPTNVVVIGTAASKEAFLGFFSTPEQAERMKSEGVVSKPTVTFLEN